MSRHLSQGSVQSTNEDKTGYDDLIDEYASPYARHSKHQINLAQLPSLPNNSPGTRCDPSFPDNASFVDKCADSDLVPSGDCAYPPTYPTKELDSRTIWQKILPDSIYCRLYVLTVVVETIIDLAIEGNLLLRFHNATAGQTSSYDQMTSRKMPVYLSVFVLAHLFQLVMAIDAVYARNTLQFIFLTMFNFLFLVYAIIQIGEIRQSLQPGLSGSFLDIPVSALTTIIPCVISAAEIAYIALGWKIYREFGWQVYKFLGADRQIKRMYASFQIFECLVKFDLFFWVAFSVQFIWLVLQKSDWEYYVTVAALPVSLLLLIEGNLAARHENKWMMLTFISGCISGMVYFVYKLVKVTMYRNTQYSSIWESLTAFSVISIALLVTTFIYSCIVMYNFGRGLKQQLTRNKLKGRDGLNRSRTQYIHRGPMNTHPNRMSID